MMCLIKKNIDYDIYPYESNTNNYVDNNINHIEEQDIQHVMKVAFFLMIYSIFMFKLIFKLF